MTRYTKGEQNILTLAGIDAFNKFCYGSLVPVERPILNKRQQEVYRFTSLGWPPAQVAEKLKIPIQGVYDEISKIRHHGYSF